MSVHATELYQVSCKVPRESMQGRKRSCKVRTRSVSVMSSNTGFPSERLKNSAYGNEEDIKAMLDYFDKSTKPIFKDATEQSYIKFGSMSCNDPKVKIRRGQLLLSGWVNFSTRIRTSDS